MFLYMTADVLQVMSLPYKEDLPGYEALPSRKERERGK